MLTCHDWYATFAALAGAARRIPADRPVDSIDASMFLLGHSPENARKSVMFFGPDGGLMSVKWRNVKTVIRYSDGVDKPIVTPQFPMFFDLGSDPHEEHNLFSARLDMGWMMIPAFKAIGEFQQSVAQYPNIKPGQDFDGYGPSQADAIATDAHATGASEHEPANASGHPPAAPAGDPGTASGRQEPGREHDDGPVTSRTAARTAQATPPAARCAGSRAARSGWGRRTSTPKSAPCTR